MLIGGNDKGDGKTDEKMKKSRNVQQQVKLQKETLFYFISLLFKKSSCSSSFTAAMGITHTELLIKGRHENVQ